MNLKRPKGLWLLHAIVLATPGLSHADPRTIGLAGTTPDLNSVDVQNQHVYDYTFSTAPTDWWVQSGVWEMTNRWECSPGWSWFGGRSNETAAVWNKRRFQGDFSLQFYFAFKHKLPGKPEQWRYQPADMGVTFCGDGKTQGSGYSLVIGADGNKCSALFKGDKRVAESKAAHAVLPHPSDGYSEDYNVMHRRWWFVRINKIGQQVDCWLDNQLLFSYKDPKPFNEGQIALWTYNNGIMLARVQMYYERELPGILRAQRTTPERRPAKILARADRHMPHKSLLRQMDKHPLRR